MPLGQLEDKFELMLMTPLCHMLPLSDSLSSVIGWTCPNLTLALLLVNLHTLWAAHDGTPRGVWLASPTTLALLTNSCVQHTILKKAASLSPNSLALSSRAGCSYLGLLKISTTVGEWHNIYNSKMWIDMKILLLNQRIQI